uniref:Uncharacterized protein n=1 Tax=Mycena chlorophos TaxID=658473 RepID=A0ABQ0KWR1_MYCCL|nr:predicted protein [Mycena chlorophos]
MHSVSSGHTPHSTERDAQALAFYKNVASVQDGRGRRLRWQARMRQHLPSGRELVLDRRTSIYYEEVG